MKHARRHTLCSLLIGMAIIAVGCSSGDNDDSGELDMDGPQTEEPVDPNGLLASLSFATADDDARYRCLLDRLGAQADSRGHEELAPVDFRGDVLKAWCTASGEDGNACLRGFVLDLRSQGSEGLAVWAFRDHADAVVQEYGYRVGRNPDASDEPIWALDFERTRGGSNGFTARFVPFDGGTRDYERVFEIGERARYSLQDAGVDDVIVTLGAESPPAQLLATLTESPARFQQLLAERDEALLTGFDAELSRRGDLTDAVRVTALARAREQFDRRGETLNESADALHGLLVDAVIGEDCG